MSEFFSPPVASGGGGGGVTTLTAVGSSPNNNSGTISGSSLTLQPADASHPGVVTALAQIFGGKKTFSPIGGSATNVIQLDPANPTGLNTGINGLAAFFASVNADLSINITNTNAGASATAFLGLGNDLANGKLAVGVTSNAYSGSFAGSIPCMDVSAWLSDSVGGSLFVNDQAAASFMWAGGASRTLLMKLDGQPGGTLGDFTLTSGHATERLLIRTQTNLWFSQIRSVNNEMDMTVQNASSGNNAFNQFNIVNDSGNGLSFGTSSSTSLFGPIQTDQGYLIAEGVNGLLLEAQAATGIIKFLTGGNHERMRIKADGTINMALQTFASDVAAGVGGLVTGDIFILTATQALTSKL